MSVSNSLIAKYNFTNRLNKLSYRGFPKKPKLMIILIRLYNDTLEMIVFIKSLI